MGGSAVTRGGKPTPPCGHSDRSPLADAKHILNLQRNRRCGCYQRLLSIAQQKVGTLNHSLPCRSGLVWPSINSTGIDQGDRGPPHPHPDVPLRILQLKTGQADETLSADITFSAPQPQCLHRLASQLLRSLPETAEFLCCKLIALHLLITWLGVGRATAHSCQWAIEPSGKDSGHWKPSSRNDAQEQFMGTQQP